MEAVDVTRRWDRLLGSVLWLLFGAALVIVAAYLARVYLLPRIFSRTSVSRLRASLRPVHVLSCIYALTVALLPPDPEVGTFLKLLLLAALYASIAAIVVSLRRPLMPGVLHSIAIVTLACYVGLWLVLLKQPPTALSAIAAITFVVVAAGLLIRLAPRGHARRRAIRRAVEVGAIPLALLPSIGFLGPELSYSLGIRFNVAVPIAAAQIALVLSAMVLAIGVGVVAHRRDVIRTRFSRLTAPLAMAGLVAAAFRLPIGEKLKIDVHHMGENLLPVQQWLDFGRLPYIDLLPTHGLASGLGYALHRVVYGFDSIDATQLVWPLLRPVGFVATYFLIRALTGSVSFAFGGPLLLYTFLHPNLGHMAPFYSVAFFGIVALGRAFRRATPGRFLGVGLWIAFVALFRLDAAVALTFVVVVVSVLYVIAGSWKLLRNRAALAARFFVVPTICVTVYLMILFATSDEPLKTLTLMRAFLTPGFQSLNGSSLQLVSPKIWFVNTNLLHILMPWLTAILGAAIALRVWHRQSQGERPDWRGLMFVALVGYNFHVLNRALDRFTDGVVGIDHPANYSMAYSLFAVAVGVQLLNPPKRYAFPTAWILAAGFTIVLTPPQLLAYVPKHVARAAIDRVGVPAATSDLLSLRYKTDPRVAAGILELEKYMDESLRPGETFVELGSQPLLHVLLRRPRPGFLVFQTATSGETFQKDFVRRWANTPAPLVVLHGGELWLVDVDGVPDAMRNYRLHEFLHHHYQLHGRVGPYVIYARRPVARAATPVPHRFDRALPHRGMSISTTADELTASVAALGSIVEIPLQQEINVSSDQEIVAEFDFRADIGGEFAVRFASAGTISNPVGFASAGERWTRYRVSSPLLFHGKVDRLRLDPPPNISDGRFSVRAMTITVGPKVRHFEDPAVAGIYDLRFLPLLWGEHDPLDAPNRTVVRWEVARHAVLAPGTEVAFPVGIAPEPANYIHVEASAGSPGELFVGYDKAAMPTSQGFRFALKPDGQMHRYFIRASPQPHWFGDRSMIARLTLRNDTLSAVTVSRIAIRSGD
ncbi:MAG TPA: hypothetical protein VGQ36_16625 [Thermoanaerobaculia bacterium]|nr:hypothetical protein [Thermoanaerobaculia bacterium]